MNTAILIFTLIIFGIALSIAFAWFYEYFYRQIKTENQIFRRRLKELTKRVNLIENKGVWSNASTNDNKAKSPNYLQNMEIRKINELKQVVAVNDETIKLEPQ